MGLREFFQWQVEQEGAASRAAVERIPEGRNRWRPHTGGMQLGQLATLVASTPGLVALMIHRHVIDRHAVACSTTVPQGTPAEWCALLTAGLERSRHALEETTEEHLLGMVRFRQDGMVVKEGPRYAMIAEAAFTQQATLRGQLNVYLAMLEAEARVNQYRVTTSERGSFRLQTSIEPLLCIFT